LSSDRISELQPEENFVSTASALYDWGDKHKKIALRKSIIMLHKKGKTQMEISFLLEVPQTTVSFWIRRFKQTKSVIDKEHPGKPGKLNKDDLTLVKEHLLGYAPERYGGESLGWTTKIAIDFVQKQFGVKYSMRRMQELFRIFGLSLITPRSDYYKSSLLARNCFRDEFKKNSKISIWVHPSLLSMK
jgi:transposase